MSLADERAAYLASLTARPCELIPAAIAATIAPQGLFEPVDPDNLPKCSPPPPRSPRVYLAEEFRIENKSIERETRAGTTKRIFQGFDQARQDFLEYAPIPQAYDQRNARAGSMRLQPTRRQLAELYRHFQK